jgi:hypothetical protein
MMRFPLPVRVEPLTSQRWTKIERSLFARLDDGLFRDVPAPHQRRESKLIVWLAAAAVLSALVVFAAGVSREDPQRAGVEHASRITTGANASHVALPGLTVDVEPESTVLIGGATERGQLLVVDRGSIYCNVAQRPLHSPVIIQAGTVQVRVVGTRFRVMRIGESARVAVDHGVVEVTMGARTSRVTAGQEWTSAAAASAPRPLSSEPSEELVSPDSPAGAVSGRHAPARQKLAPPAAPSSGRADAAMASTQARFEQAARLERSDPARALALYASVQRGADSWAQHALFAQGRLQAARGNKAEARRLLQQYVTRFPQGANGDDARLLLDQMR